MQLSAIAEAESKQAEMEFTIEMLADEQPQRTSEADSVPADLNQVA